MRSSRTGRLGVELGIFISQAVRCICLGPLSVIEPQSRCLTLVVSCTCVAMSSFALGALPGVCIIVWL